MSPTDTIAGGFKANLVAKVVEVGVNGLLILLLTNVFLTNEEYGLLYLAISIFGMAVFFSRMGFAKSAARYVTEYRESDPSKVPTIVRRSLLFNLASIGLVSSVVIVFREPIVAGFGEPELVSLLSLGVLFIVAQTLHSYAYFLCQGFNRVQWSAIVMIVSNLGIFTFAIGLLSLGFGIAGALLGYVVGYALGATVGLTVLYRWVSQLEDGQSLAGTEDGASADEPDEPDEDSSVGNADESDTGGSNAEGSTTGESDENLTRRILEYSLPLTITGASSIMFKRVDIVLVGAFLSPVAVAAYTLAKQLTEFVMAPASSLGFAMAPSYGESKSGNEIDQAAAIYETTFEYNLLFYVPAAVGIALVADPAIRHVFGEGYLGAIPIVQVLSIFVVLQSINKITNDALDFLGRARHRAMSKGGAAIFNLGLNIVLIPTIGAIGAAISTVLSYAIMAAVNVYLIHAELSLPIRSLAVTTVQVSAIAVGMGLAVLAVLPYASSVVSVLAVIALGVAVWLALSVSSGLLDLRWAVSQLR